MAAEHLQTNVVDDLQAEQRRRWLAGDRVPVETFLSLHPDLATRADDVVDLIVAEVQLRQSQGERPEQAEYVDRFPDYAARSDCAARLENLFEPAATWASVAGGSTRQDPQSGDKHLGGKHQGGRPSNGSFGPDGLLETAAADGPTGDARAAMRATASFGSLPHGNLEDPMRATASFGAPSTQANSPSSIGPRPAAPKLAPATEIGRYKVKRKLGEGAFGLVYLAFDPDLKRDVAIKVPHSHMVASAAAAESYLSEAQNVARLDHPGIVPVYDVGRTADGQCYVVSKYIPGGSLEQTMKEPRPFDASVRLVAEIAEALHHAHQRGLVHRDIKPANILVDEAGHPLVADFGLALKDEEFGKGAAFSGTPAYMSPEQARREGNIVDVRSDIYSLGVVLFELLVGRIPYRSKTVTDLLNEVATIETRPPRQLDDKIPHQLDQICTKALSKRPADRYSTALDMAKVLRAAVAQPSGRPRLARRVALTLGIAAVLIGWFWMARNRPGADSGTRGPSALAASVGGNSPAGDPLSSGSPAATPAAGVQLEIHYQRKDEEDGFHTLSPKDAPLTNGDKVQVHVHTARPQYLYVYWYDPQGQSRRLWPQDAQSQQELNDLAVPAKSDKWFEIDGSNGNEMVVVGTADKPLDATTLAALEQTPSLTPGVHMVKNPLMLPLATGTERGLGAEVTLRKSPLSSGFEDLLHADFGAYRGIVVPHE